jgi:hypothetical protein
LRRVDRIRQPQGWIFNASSGNRPEPNAIGDKDEANIYENVEFRVDNKLHLSPFNMPHLKPNSPAIDEELNCRKLNKRHLLIDNSSGALRLVGVFTMKLADKYEIYSLVDNLDLDFGSLAEQHSFLDGKTHFAAAGTAVLYKENDKFRIQVVGHDEDFTGQGWIFDATEID